MPMTKKLLGFFIEKEQLETISLRSYLLDKYKLTADILLLLIIPLSLWIVIKLALLKTHRRLISITDFLEQQNNTAVKQQRATA